jgi:ABC-type sugar transport system ATPase subunit
MDNLLTSTCSGCCELWKDTEDVGQPVGWPTGPVDDPIGRLPMMAAGAEVPALALHDVTTRFPGVIALNGISLEVNWAEVHAICSENGAGMSNLISILGGILPLGWYEGGLTLDGKSFKPNGVRAAEARGIVVIHQELALCDNLSIADNIFLGHELTGGLLLDEVWTLYSLSHDIISALQGAGYTVGSDWSIVTGGNAELDPVTAILAGEQYSSSFDDWRDLAKAIGDQVVDVLDDGETDVELDTENYNNGSKVVPTMLFGRRNVTKANVEPVLVESGFYTADQFGLQPHTYRLALRSIRTRQRRTTTQEREVTE